MTPALKTLNDATPEGAAAMMEPLVERSAWVAEAAAGERPFADVPELVMTLVDIILRSGRDRQIGLFRVHPEIAGSEARQGRMTAASAGEQSRLSLLSLTPADTARLEARNAAYRDRFGYPFIVALHRVPDLETLFEIFDRRLSATAVEEHAATLAEIASVIQSRANRAFGPAQTPSDLPIPATQE